MITFRLVPLYSHATPVAPAGSDAPPPPATETGSGRLMPRAAPTVAPVGQLPAAVVAAWLETGAVVVDVVAAEVAAAGVATVDGAPPPEPPQPERVTPKTSAVATNQRELLCDT
jgi:hypothetical protein